MENIENIKKEIKEKIKNNPRYVNSCSKEFQEDIKRYGLNSGYEFTTWMQNNGILKSVTKIYREDNERIAENAGCKDLKEYWKLKSWNIGRHSPKEENEKCTAHLGVVIGESYTKNVLSKLFEHVEEMQYGNPGFDFICKNPKQKLFEKYPQFKLENNKEYKIDTKSRCLKDSHPNTHYLGTQWRYAILYNNIADYFMLLAWDNEKDLNPIYTWFIYKYEIIRGKKFWKRDDITITNKPNLLKEFDPYQIGE